MSHVPLETQMILESCAMSPALGSVLKNLRGTLSIQLKQQDHRVYIYSSLHLLRTVWRHL